MIRPVLLAVLFLYNAYANAECLKRELPPGLGGAVDASLSPETLERWLKFRQARVEERMQEAWDPQRVKRSYHVTQEQLESGCLTTEQIIDLGRALFLRDFNLTDGLGNAQDGVSWQRRLQKAGDQSAHATSCVSCHWKGAFAGGGDKVDNAYLNGDGDTLLSHQERNPISLVGSGWIQLLASEMTDTLHNQRDQLINTARKKGVASGPLTVNGVQFGRIKVRIENSEISIDSSQLEGVQADLIIRPFGWQGRFATLYDMVEWSFLNHLGMSSKLSTTGKLPEITAGQLTAVTLFLATLSSPVIEVPTFAGHRLDRSIPLAKSVYAPEFTHRWALGQKVFEEIGCAQCHRPSLALQNDKFTVAKLSVPLHDTAALPHPEGMQAAHKGAQAPTEVFIFSDLKLHDMGYGQFVTRPLWGLRNSAPYSFDGSANVVDQAINKHAAPGGAAEHAALNFATLNEKHKADLRVYLYSLMLAPQIRIR